MINWIENNIKTRKICCLYVDKYLKMSNKELNNFKNIFVSIFKIVNLKDITLKLLNTYTKSILKPTYRKLDSETQ